MFSINYASVANLDVENSCQALIYGWDHCKYIQLREALQKSDSPIKKVFNESLGNNFFYSNSQQETLEGRRIEHVETNPKPIDRAKSNHAAMRRCKGAITNLVVENYKRIVEGLPIIPLIFCVDIDNNQHPMNADTITREGRKGSRRVTNSELRRCYKICKELEDSEIVELRIVSYVAKLTIKFVKLEQQQNGTYSLTQKAAFWEAADWNQKWRERKSKSASDGSAQLTKTTSYWWTSQILTSIQSYDRSKVFNIADEQHKDYHKHHSRL